MNLLDLYFKSVAEQNEIKNYVLTKPLARPKTNIFTVVFIICAYAAACFLIAFGILAACDITKCVEILYIAVYFAGFLLIAKLLCIKLVECYQHYAKEATRRKCLCMPTCSEYALEVLKKYSLIKALYKIWKRLFKTCKNGVYKKDFP